MAAAASVASSIRAVGAGRHAQDDLVHAGHPGGDGAHEDGGGIAGPAARGVAARPGHRPDQVAHGDPAGLEVVGLGRRLVGVVGEDPVVGHTERLGELGGTGSSAAWTSPEGTRRLVDAHPSNRSVSRRSADVAARPTSR